MTTQDFDGRLRELKSAWTSRNEENDRILSDAPIENGVMNVDAKHATAFQTNTAEMGRIRQEMDMITAQKEQKEWGSQSAGSVSQAFNAGGQVAGARGEYKSVGNMFLDSPEFKDFAASGGLTMNQPWEVKGMDLAAHWIGASEQKDVYTSLPTGAITRGFAPLQHDPMVMRPYRKSRVRDLFPVQTTTAALIEYFKVTGFGVTNAASMVPERTSGAFTAKPHTALNFVGAQAPVRTIAHWEAAHRNVLRDVPQLQGVIDNELLYGLRLREDDQILNGTGNGEDLLGITQEPSIQTFSRAGSPPANENKADDIRRAATKAILAFYEPTGVVMHPSDWESIELLKDTTGGYIIAIVVAMGGTQRLWRLPVIDTPAMTQSKFLVGAFGLGAQLYDREEANIRIAEQHSDFFIRNAIVVLAEQRLALAIKRPESFVYGTFGA